MPGAPRLNIARVGFDARKADLRDFALSSKTPLQKFYKVMRSTTNQTLKHGLSYPPAGYFLREITSSPRCIGHSLGGGKVLEEDIVFTKETYTPYWAGSYAPPITDSASIAFLSIDPLGPTNAPLKKLNNPRVVLRRGGEDYEKDIHSGYDTLKVFKSGNLTLNLPQWTTNSTASVDKRSTSFVHNLGYCPFFAPFVPYETSLAVHYGWLYQWHNQGGWQAATEYIPIDNVYENPNFYECIKRHTSSSATKPGSGAQWTTYWKQADYTDQYYPDNVDINSLEDVKIIYGGIGGFYDVIIRIWVTSTQLVMETERWADTTFGPVTMKAQTISMDYTVFYNRVDEEFDLLTS